MSQLDDLLDEQRAQQQTVESTEILRRVKHEHGRTMALLVASLAELRKRCQIHWL